LRTIVCLPAVVGAWRYAGGGAFLSTSKLYGFNREALQRPDLIPAGHAHHQHGCNSPRRCTTSSARRRCGRCTSTIPTRPPSAPDQARVLAGLRRDDLFTVVHEQFPTDTADYADLLLPATTQLEHFDLHGSYGHFLVQTNEPAIAPLAEAKPNTEVFRLLARGGWDSNRSCSTSATRSWPLWRSRTRNGPGLEGIGAWIGCGTTGRPGSTSRRTTPRSPRGASRRRREVRAV